jgi:hypothetical protein
MDIIALLLIILIVVAIFGGVTLHWVLYILAAVLVVALLLRVLDGRRGGV